MTLAEEIREQGCVLLRGAIPFGKVIHYRNALDDIYRGAQGNGDVSGQEFYKRSGLRMKEFFSATATDRVALEYLGRCSAFNSTFLTVSANAENSIRGLGLHTDGIIQGTKENVLCMWAPLHDCGIDAPGLAVVRAGRDAVIGYLREHFHGRQIPGWHSAEEWASTKAFTEESISAKFGEPWKPVMEPGDVMIFTNWTIHGSNITARMKQRRSAAIYRLSDDTLLRRLKRKLTRH